MNLAAPEIPQTNNTGMENFLRGFSLTAAMANKRNQLEASMQRLQLMKYADDLKHQTDMDRLGTQGEHYRQMYEIGEKTNELKERKLSAVIDQGKQDMDRLIEMQGKIYSIQPRRGTTAFQKAMDDIKDEYSDVTGSAEAKRILSPIESQHKTARQEGFKAFNNQIQSLGIPPQYAPAIFGTPEMWQGQDDTKDPKNPKMTFQIGNNKIAVPKSTYDKLKPKYAEYYDVGSAVVKPPSLQDRAQAALDDPDATPAEKEAAKKILGQ